MANTFTWRSTGGAYHPWLTERDDYAESAADFCTRVGKILPKFPGEVLAEWFYDHWSQIDQWAWLGYESLDFERVRWSTSDVLRSGINDNRTVLTDQRHYEAGVTTPRIERIAEHFRSTGTWPVPPIFLANCESTIIRPDGFRPTSPYHVIEGNHRAALFCTFAGHTSVGPEHDVWVAAVPDA